MQGQSPARRKISSRNLRQRTDIIIKPADKGSAAVVLSKEDYIKEANRQLNESIDYLKLPADPTSQYTTDSMYRRELIDKKVKNFLVTHHPRAARFYLLPKMHKPGNPGRPIVTSNGVLTTNISHFADFFSTAERDPTSITFQDTMDFINKLWRLLRLPPGCLLVTLNVSLLYTNIPHEEGITACEEFLNHREPGPSYD